MRVRGLRCGLRGATVRRGVPLCHSHGHRQARPYVVEGVRARFGTGECTAGGTPPLTTSSAPSARPRAVPSTAAEETRGVGTLLHLVRPARV